MALPEVVIATPRVVFDFVSLKVTVSPFGGAGVIVAVKVTVVPTGAEFPGAMVRVVVVALVRCPTVRVCPGEADAAKVVSPG
jgi:hypothetical protein